MALGITRLKCKIVGYSPEVFHDVFFLKSCHKIHDALLALTVLLSLRRSRMASKHVAYLNLAQCLFLL